VPLSKQCEYLFYPKFCLTLCHQTRNPELVKRSLLYHNKWIIAVLYKSFFSGGMSSFMTRFDRLFTSTSQDAISPVCCQVPLPMVALVATAVSWKSNLFLHPTLICFCFFSVICCSFGVAHRRETTHRIHRDWLHRRIYGKCGYLAVCHGP